MRHGDRGSASVLLLGLAGLLVLVAVLVTGIGAVAVTRHRAASAADLAALAAADAALQGPEVACAAAARVLARAAGAALEACRLDGDVAEVAVVVRPGGVLGRLGAARGVARAGPTAPAPAPAGTPTAPRASGCRRPPDLPRVPAGNDSAATAFHAERTAA